MAFYLQVNGLAATAEGTRKRCMEFAERGHKQYPDAVVKLMKYDHKTNTDILVQHLY